MISYRPINGPVTPKNFANLRSGDRITLKALKPIAHSIWQVSYRGKLFPVSSAIPLKPGKMYTGRVYWKGNTLIFKTEAQVPSGSPGEISAEKPAEYEVINVLQRLHMPISAEAIQWIERHAGTDKKNVKILRILAHLFDKKIELAPGSSLMDPLYIFSGDDHGEGKRKNDQRESGSFSPGPNTYEKVKKEFKNLLKKSIESGGSSPLQLFNHILSAHDHWLIVPVGFESGSLHVEGSLRCKVDTSAGTIQALSVVLNVNGEESVFSIPSYRSKHPVLKVYGKDPGVIFRNKGFLRNFSEKLSKLGIELDDTINDGNLFDGFEEIKNTGLKSVDTVI